MNIKLFPLSLFQRSIVRRSSVVLLTMLPGFLLNYALYLGASRILPVTDFGIFYVAISISNILFVPAVFIGFFYTREITGRLENDGLDMAVAEFRGFVRHVVRVGALGTIGLIAMFSLIGGLMGIDSILLIVFLVLSIYSNYLVESVRVGLQGLQRFVWFGIASLIWMTFRFAFGMSGLYIVGRVWSGVAGIMLSSILVFTCFYFFIIGQTPSKTVLKQSKTVEVRRLLVFMVSFGVFSCVMYLDIMVAYASLNQTQLAIYSASSVLPKSIVMVLFPLGRILFSVMSSTQATGQSQKINVLKGLGLMALLSSAGVCVLVLCKGWVCNSAIGVISCNADLMTIIAGSAVSICLLLIWVLVQFARGLDWHPLLLIFPIILYIGYVMLTAPDVNGLALSYLVFSSVTLVVYTFLCLPYPKIHSYLKEKVSIAS